VRFTEVLPAAEELCAKIGITAAITATAPAPASTGNATNATATLSGIRSATATGPGGSPQNTGAAAANIAGLGAVVLGMAAVLGL
jgi:hypothetical protein